jgi:hypothetical protein
MLSRLTPPEILARVREDLSANDDRVCFNRLFMSTVVAALDEQGRDFAEACRIIKQAHGADALAEWFTDVDRDGVDVDAFLERPAVKASLEAQ